MSAMPNFEPSFVKVGKLIPFYLDFSSGPAAKKLGEVLKEKEKREAEGIEGIISEVCRANICQKSKYKRRGKRRLLWGLWEEEPVEEVSISIMGHFDSRKLLET